jgi:signal transduction histidine kinase
MISGMDAHTARPPAAADPAPTPWRLPAVLAGVAGALILVVSTSPLGSDGLQEFLYTPGYGGVYDPANLNGWIWLALPVAATVLGLCLLRWWPYLLLAAALMLIPGILSEIRPVGYPFAVFVLPQAGYYLAIIAMLACAQGLIRGKVGWGAAVAALSLGSRLAGTALGGASWDLSPDSAGAWHIALLALGLAGLAPALWQCRRGDPDAAEPAGRWTWRRTRLVLAGTLAAAVPIPLASLTTGRLANLLGVTYSALYRHDYAQTAAIGAVSLVAVAVLAAVAGLWSLAGALSAALAQAAVMVPALLAVTALEFDDPARWLGALAGAALGAAAAGSRWRVPLAATLTVLAATALFIAYAATTGDPQKLADQRVVIPSVLILVLCLAAAGAVVGATAPVLAPRGALPAVLGPLAGALAVGGLQTIRATYGLTDTIGLIPLSHLTTSAVLLLVAGAAVGGLGFAQLLTTRRAERKLAEQIRREAAEAERDRLARPIHDGVLQVLALVQRHGAELGGQGSELAALAGEQEVALRTLLTGGSVPGRDGAEDLRGPLRTLATPAVDVVTPAQPVALPAGTVAEVVAAVRAALDNVRKHAGPGARAWILLEDERDGVRVTVRDDGVGFPPQRLEEAAEAGRLGIAQSMRGRISDRGGSTVIQSRPGEGTEVEFWLPRTPSAGR